MTIISLYQKRKQWVDDFRALYAEFWNDKDISQVRRWIVSNKLYDEELKPVLAQRIEKGYNDLDEDGSAKRGFQPSSDTSSSWLPLTQNLANRAMVRSTISLDFETIRFIPIKPLVARASTVLDSYAAHSRLP